jgi:micrococcal nuclease
MIGASALIGLALSSMPIQGHPGRTNASGCHTCRTNCAKWGLSTGEYHCHGGGSSAAPSIRPRPTPQEPALERSPAPSLGLAERSEISVDVVAVVDGDTFVARAEGELHLFALGDIDAPELEQPFGDRARDWLTERLLSRRITVLPANGEGCRIRVEIPTDGGRSLNEALLEAGVAWAEPSASDAWKKLEAKARLSEVGLWGGARPEAPWEFRDRTIGRENSRNR